MAWAALVDPVGLAAAAAKLLPARRFDFVYEGVLGTTLELQVHTGTRQSAVRSAEAALAEIDRLEPLLSSYDPQSALRRWQAQPPEPAPLPQELLEVLQASLVWHARSGGAFHPGVESLTRLWKAAQARGEMPTEGELAPLRAQLAEPLWSVDPRTGTAHRQTACALSLNAIAKGFIVDKASWCAVEVPGVRGVLLSIGGDLRVRGSQPYRVGIADPRHDAENAPPQSVLSLQEAALATSGGYRRGFSLEGRWFSHLLDPRTGWPVEQGVSASVVAPSALEADVLATICSLLTPEESLALAESVPGCAVFLVTPEGAVYQSARWGIT